MMRIGSTMATRDIVTLAASSARLTNGVPTPKVVALITGRAVAFTPCTPSAISTPAAIGTH